MSARLQEQQARPTAHAPRADAPYDEKAAWAYAVVSWRLGVGGGAEEHPDGGLGGHAWRLEFFECARDPQAYERMMEGEENEQSQDV